MRFHILSLAHLPVSKRFNSCAFTQKMIKFDKMMRRYGHEVYVYGCDGQDEGIGTEYIVTHHLEDVRKAWGDEGNNSELGYDWQKEQGFRFEKDTDKQKEVHDSFLDACIVEVGKRKQDSDFLVLTMGNYHMKVDKALNMPLTVETGIGYRGSYARFRAFESQFIMNYSYGLENWNKKGGEQMGRGKFLDRVIPNYFELSEFDFTLPKEDYMLYLGRITPLKGVHVAMRLAHEMKYKLIIAGQGDIEVAPEYQKYIEFVGFADVEKRKELMGKAKLFIAPTLYLEPFGGVVVEAMLSGTPVLASNAGAFPELVRNGETGFCCNTFRDYVEYANLITRADLRGLKKLGLDNISLRNKSEQYGIDAVYHQFMRWFRDIEHVYNGVSKGDNDAWYRL